MNYFLLISIHSIVICIESCLFGIFVSTVFVDQIQSITNDRSLIDTLQLEKNPRMAEQILPPRRALFQQVFGPGPMICWLFPCDLKTTHSPVDTPEMYTV